MTKINTDLKRPGGSSAEIRNEHCGFLTRVLDIRLTLKLMASQRDAIKQEMNSSHERNERIQDTGYWHRDNIEKTLKMIENKEWLNRVLKIKILTFKTGENVPIKQPLKRPELTLKPDFLNGFLR